MELFKITFQLDSENDEDLTAFQYVAANSIVEAIECFKKNTTNYILKAEHIDEIIIQETEK